MSPDLKETLKYLQRRKSWPESEQLLTVIVNLLYENGDDRKSAAVYTRTFQIGKLRVEIDFRDSNHEQKEK